MAIHDSLPGVSIVVCINDEPQPEYDDSSTKLEGSAAKNTVIKYIVSTVGTTFDIQAIIDDTVAKDKSLVFDLWIDGRFVEGAMGVWNHELAEQGMDVLIISKGEHVGLRGQNKVLIAPFKFADLEIGGWPSMSQCVMVFVLTDMQLMTLMRSVLEGIRRPPSRLERLGLRSCMR